MNNKQQNEIENGSDTSVYVSNHSGAELSIFTKKGCHLSSTKRDHL